MAADFATYNQFVGKLISQTVPGDGLRVPISFSESVSPIRDGAAAVLMKTKCFCNSSYESMSKEIFLLYLMGRQEPLLKEQDDSNATLALKIETEERTIRPNDRLVHVYYFTLVQGETLEQYCATILFDDMALRSSSRHYSVALKDTFISSWKVLYACFPMSACAKEQILPAERVVQVPCSVDPIVAVVIFKGLTVGVLVQRCFQSVFINPTFIKAFGLTLSFWATDGCTKNKGPVDIHYVMPIFARFNKSIRILYIHCPGRDFEQRSTIQGNKEGQQEALMALWKAAFPKEDTMV
ncbi:hypothetical protein Tco_1275043 [Tanacetum coccineum]